MDTLPDDLTDSTGKKLIISLVYEQDSPPLWLGSEAESGSDRLWMWRTLRLPNASLVIKGGTT